MAEKKSALPRIFLESFAVFASVLLAFLVEQWREDLNEAREADAALNLVRTELQENLAELERIVPRRASMLEAYQKAMVALMDDNVFPSTLPDFETPQVTSLAYELATDSGAVVEVEASDLLVIARAYESLDEVRRNELFLNNRNAQIRFNDGEQYLSGFIYYLNRAEFSEPAAIADIQEAIVLLNSILD